MLCRYERTIFKSDKGFCIFAYSTSDESVPKEARNRSYYHDDKIHFTAIGYHLIATDAVEVELDGTWENSKHGLQLSVSMCKEVVPRDQAGIRAYLRPQRPLSLALAIRRWRFWRKSRTSCLASRGLPRKSSRLSSNPTGKRKP